MPPIHGVLPSLSLPHTGAASLLPT
jgi:hypothetical protein